MSKQLYSIYTHVVKLNDDRTMNVSNEKHLMIFNEQQLKLLEARNGLIAEDLYPNKLTDREVENLITIYGEEFY